MITILDNDIIENNFFIDKDTFNEKLNHIILESHQKYL